jgi:hypothetical protein
MYLQCTEAYCQNVSRACWLQSGPPTRARGGPVWGGRAGRPVRPGQGMATHWRATSLSAGGGGGPRAWGTVGTGQAGSPGPGGVRAGTHRKMAGSGHGHGWARGPGSGSSGGPNKRAGSPGDRPAVPGRTARAVPAPLPGPRDRARETRGRSALTPGVRDPGTSPTRRVRDCGRRRNTGGPRAVGWRARADRARLRTRTEAAGLRPYGLRSADSGGAVAF